MTCPRERTTSGGIFRDLSVFNKPEVSKECPTRTDGGHDGGGGPKGAHSAASIHPKPD